MRETNSVQPRHPVFSSPMLNLFKAMRLFSWHSLHVTSLRPSFNDRAPGKGVFTFARGLNLLPIQTRLLLKSKIMNLSSKIARFLKDESGPTAVEYAVMLALLITAMFGTIAIMGQTANSTFENTNTKLGEAAGTGG